MHLVSEDRGQTDKIPVTLNITATELILLSNICDVLLLSNKVSHQLCEDCNTQIIELKDLVDIKLTRLGGTLLRLKILITNLDNKSSLLW